MAFGWLDVLLLVVFLVVSVGIGIFHGIRGLKSSPEEYLMGGRSMKPIYLGVSMTMGTVSAISIMGNAGEIYAYGTQYWVMDVGVALGMVFVAHVFMPVFFPLNMISLYQYIEERFESKWLRRATVLLNTILAYFFIGFLLFPASTFLFMTTKLPIGTNILIFGLLCSLYSSFGGVKAVVYSDVFQSVVMVAGILTIIIQGSLSMGGLEAVWLVAEERGRIQFFNFSLDPFQRHSFWLVITYGFFFSVSTYGVVQSQAQRAFSTGSLQHAKRVLFYGAIGMVTIRGLICLSGIVIFANYANCDPLTAGATPMKAFNVIPLYVLQTMTQISGLAGVFVAAIYAAALSSVSTQVNSITALLWEDFLKDLTFFQGWSEVKVANLQKIIVFVSGIIGIGFTFLVLSLVSFLESLLKITGAMSGPMVGLFLVAVYLPWVKSKGAAFGFMASIGLSLWMVLEQLSLSKEPYLPLSREGCPAPSAPSISGSETHEASNSSSSFLQSDAQTGYSVFQLSYCLNYCWGTLICVTVALIITALTGSNNPSTVDERTVAPIAWRIFVRYPRTHFRGSSLFRNRKRPPSQKDPQASEDELEHLKKVVLDDGKPRSSSSCPHV